MPMRMKELVGELFKELQKILSVPQVVCNDQDELIHLASELNLADVVLLLRKNQLNNAEVSEKNVSEFVQFLADVWEKSKNTNKIYQHNHNSHANLFCIKMADILSREVKTLDRLKLLMPTLKNTDFPAIKKLNQYIMSDDNTTMIDVIECLKNMEKNRQTDTRLYHPGTTNPLTDAETQRIAKFNMDVSNYYQLLLRKDASQKNISKYANTANKNIGFKPVSSSYGLIGYEKLADDVYGDINHREDLIGKLLKLPAVSWLKLLNNIKVATLKNLILANQAGFYEAVIQPSSYCYTDEKQDRATLLLFAYLYYKQLEARDVEYTGMFGSWTGYSKQDKLSAALLLINFLTSRRPLSDFQAYLKEKPTEKLLGPLMANTLGSLTNQVVICSKINYEAAKQAIITEQRASVKI